MSSNTCPWCNANLIVTTYVCGSYFNDDGVLRQSADCREAEYIHKRIKEEVLKEREACAKLVEEFDLPFIADAIRARGDLNE